MSSITADLSAQADTETEIKIEETEAYATLLARLGRKSPHIPGALIVRHVMDRVPASEWPIRIAAIDAIVRRLDAVKSDALRVSGRPDSGRVFGVYYTRRGRETARPYRTILRSIDPIQGVCDCPDFLRNSLGLCKHMLAVLISIYGKPNTAKRALREQERRSGIAVPGLRWDPIRPLEGRGDWLSRVEWVDAPQANDQPQPRESVVGKWFEPVNGGGRRVLKSRSLENRVRRLALVEDLLELIPSDPRAARHDPALRTLLRDERARLRLVAQTALSASEIRGALKGFKRGLYPYQREGVEKFLRCGRLLLADDMGLGKTAQAIACSHALRRTGRVKRGLIIAPASLKPQWEREWMLFTDEPVTVVDGSPADRHAVYTKCKDGFLIINYEQLIRDLDVIRRWNPDFVILDEAQRIKNWATKTALSVKGLTPPYRLVLTGTPMENRIDELASVVEWVDDQALEPKWRLQPLHAVRADGRHEVTGVRGLDTLRTRLEPCMIRRVRQEVLNQLPPRTDTRVPVEMTEEQKAEHDALVLPIAALVARAKVRPLTQVEFLRLMTLLTTQRIISNGMVQLRFTDEWPTLQMHKPEDGILRGLAAPKLGELRQLVRQLVLEQGRKVVIFSQWRRMLALAQWAVSDLLAQDDLRAGFFTGQEKQRRRTQNIVEFHEDPAFRILFASDAGGVGLNLQRASNCVINLELPWNPAVLEQRIGRIYRLGQTQPIDVFNLVTEYGIESRIAGLVGAKQAFFKGLFDGDSDTVQFEQSGSFLDRVERIITPAPVSGTTPPDEVDVAAAGSDDLDNLEYEDEVPDAYEELVEAADEAEDHVNEPAQASPAVASADGEKGVHEPVIPSDEPFELPGAGEIRRLFSQLQIRRAPTGSVIIEAPDEAAATLGALFEGMAALLRSPSGTPQAQRGSQSDAPRAS